MRWLAPLIAAALCACAPSSADPPAIPEQWRAVVVQSTPVDFGADRLGRLVFRGGVELTSDDDVFGGLSGIEVLDGDRLVALNDDAEWFEARLVLDASGALTGVTDVRYALMRNERGEPFPDKQTGDSEGLAQLPDGRFAVSFEQTQSIRIFDLNRDGPFGASTFGPRLTGTASLPPNAGLEALASTADGVLIVGAEGGERATTPLWRVSLDAREPAAPLIGYPLRFGFSLTGMDRTPDGNFVALERFYAPIVGARARITRFPATALNARGDTLPDLEELALIAPPLPVDNFEGIAATQMSNGVTRIYIVSDDNYNRRQRTLLYAFDVVSESP